MKSQYFHLIMAVVTFVGTLATPRIKAYIRMEGHRRSRWDDKNISTCEPLRHPQLQGCEDMHLYEHNGQRRIYLLCNKDVHQDKIRWFPGHGHRDYTHFVHDDIYMLNPDANELVKLELNNFDPALDFTTHGFDVVASNKDPSSVIIYAINHRRSGSVIERFRHQFGSNSAVHERTYNNQTFVHHPNDVFAPDENTFYVTNDHKYSDHVWRTAETVLQLSTGNVAFWDGQAYKTASTGLIGANGIIGERADQGKRVFVSEAHAARARFYEREDNGNLTLRSMFQLEFGPDNISLSQKSKDILFAGFPRLSALNSQASNPGARSHEVPSVVARIPSTQFPSQFGGRKRPIVPSVEEVLFSNGKNGVVSGATTALVDEESDSLFLTNAFGYNVVRCKGYSKF